jgi:hypothetical protein
MLANGGGGAVREVVCGELVGVGRRCLKDGAVVLVVVL